MPAPEDGMEEIGWQNRTISPRPVSWGELAGGRGEEVRRSGLENPGGLAGSDVAGLVVVVSRG